MTLEEPVFFETDLEVIKNEMIAYYENQVNVTLSPGQAETLLINAFAYREHLLRIQGNAAAKANLLEFSKYPMIDYLGAFLGVVRLDASSALCEIEFSLVEGHGDFVIPAGIRVQSIDGKVVFKTLFEIIVLTADETVNVAAQCTVDGTIANNYAIGQISIILDPQAYVATATNIGITSGGADQENDEELKERIMLAPSSFSTAGPTGAYEYFAKSAHPSIIDVKVTSLVPGTVNIYPLTLSGELSDEVRDAVFAKVNDEKVRPLTDTPVVEAPDKIEYEITVNLTLLTGAQASVIQGVVLAKLQEYALDRKNRLAADVVISQIIGKASIEGVYNVEVELPVSDVEVGFSEVAFCTDVTVNVAGYSDE